MKTASVFVITVLLFSIVSYGQQTKLSFKEGHHKDSLEVTKINTYIQQVFENNQFQKQIIDSILLPNKFEKQQHYKLTISKNNHDLVRLSLIPISNSPKIEFILSSVINYIIKDEHLIAVTEQYMNNSRMGSCGTLSIENRLYFKHNTLFATYKKETPFLCYNSPINSEWLLENFKKVEQLITDID